MTFHTVTADQINATHTLFRFLRKLGCIGMVKTQTQSIRLTEMNRPERYRLHYVGYDAEAKGKLTPEDILEDLFGRPGSIDNAPRDKRRPRGSQLLKRPSPLR